MLRDALLEVVGSDGAEMSDDEDDIDEAEVGYLTHDGEDDE